MEIKVNIKPLTINKVWRGRRFKTKLYENYERDLNYLLPNTIQIVDGVPLKLIIEFGISALMDIDNGLKPLIDILQKKYSFNDRYIMELNVKKTIVKRKEHFITIEIEYI